MSAEHSALQRRLAALLADYNRVRKHTDHPDACVRRHAREWLSRLETELLVFARWLGELNALEMRS